MKKLPLLVSLSVLINFCAFSKDKNEKIPDVVTLDKTINNSFF
jgi:hypothetical protein